MRHGDKRILYILCLILIWLKELDGQDSAYAQTPQSKEALDSLQFLNESFTSPHKRSLHLLISHAELPAHKPSGALWDYGSGAPDALMTVRYPKYTPKASLNTPPWNQEYTLVTTESEIIRDDYMPIWLFSLSFVDLVGTEQIGVIVELYDQDPIGRQLIERFTIYPPTQAQIGQLLSLKGTQGAILYFEWRALARSRQVTDITPIATIDRKEQPLMMKPLVAADHREAQRLYRIYIRAQLDGDHLGAQQALLQLTQKYQDTRYGRKALRILAPFAR